MPYPIRGKAFLAVFIFRIPAGGAGFNIIPTGRLPAREGISQRRPVGITPAIIERVAAKPTNEQILNWEWFKKKNTLSLFIYLLLKANYCDTTFEGQIIHRGQIVTTLPKLACETGQTIKEVRDALSHLIRTGEVADKTTNKYRVITIVKYDEYQKDGRQMGSQRADKGQTNGQSKGSMYRIYR